MQGHEEKHGPERIINLHLPLSSPYLWNGKVRGGDG